MASTTVRVDAATHAPLRELASLRGASVMDTVRDAAEALRRREFGRRVTTELAALRATSAWVEYVDETEATSVSDGVR